MIKVQRTPTPAVLRKNSGKWLQAFLSAKTREKRRAAQDRYRHPEVKKALVELFHGKCAYCESRIVHIDYGHIEHFRPKSGPVGNPQLTFEWTNPLLACGICNGGQHKSDRFPESDEGGPIVDPCREEPSRHLDFVYDKITRLTSVYGKDARGKTTEQLLGLNRTELRRHRSSFVSKLYALSLSASSNPEAQELLLRAIQADAEYVAFARTLVSP